jgi:NADPH:quinone reductase-like Zn-dependent oxidoreductase
MQRILVRRPGGFDRLELVSGEPPVPGPGEVLVRTVAAGVNFADCVVRMGLYPSARDYVGWPITPGFEFSGHVAGLGPGVNEFTPGEPVFGACLFGGYTTHVVVPTHQLLRPPSGVDLVAAAGVPVAHLTAWYALVEKGAAAPGKKVLVHSAAGGVGGALVRIARLLGCDVAAVVGSPAKAEVARAAGAQLVIDKSREPLFEVARGFAPEGFDLVFDANGVETLRGSYRALRPTGRLVVYGAHTMLTRGSGRRNWLALAFNYLRTPRFDPLEMTNANKSVLAFNLSYLFGERPILDRALADVLGWLTSGELQLPRVTCYPLAEAARAHADLQSGATTGKLLLLTTSQP